MHRLHLLKPAAEGSAVSPAPLQPSENEKVLQRNDHVKEFFDLETTAIAGDDNTVPIAALCGDKIFSAYDDKSFTQRLESRGGQVVLVDPIHAAPITEWFSITWSGQTSSCSFWQLLDSWTLCLG